jgi:NADH:ubiquinone oxidoreductase subunit E
VTRFDHLRGVPGSRDRLAAQVWEGARVERGPAEVPEPADVEVPAELRATIEHHMSLYPEKRSAVLPALRAAQERHGWLSPQAMDQVAAVMQVTPAYLESVATFYDLFELQPVGHHTIYMCTNLSCQLRGALDVLDAFAEATGAPVKGSSPDGQFQLRPFECLGACDLAPMASIAGHYRGPLSTEDAFTIADQLRGGDAPADVLPEKKLKESAGPRLGEGRAPGGKSA